MLIRLRELGRKTGQFLLLGSASMELLRQSSESLAGRIKTRSKRGIGLHMLARIADSIDFSNEGYWNCTSLSFRILETQKRSSDMQDFSVEIIPVDNKGIVVLRPKGSIDSLSTPILEERFEAAIAKGQYRIVVDLKNTDFVSSAGLGLLLGTVATLRENGGDLILMNIPDEVSDVFHIMSVDDYFRIIERLDELTTTKV